MKRKNDNLKEVFPDGSKGDCDIFAVFDFDETLAITESKVHVVDSKGRRRRSYTPDEYAVKFGSGEEKLRKNESFDFSDFDSIDHETTSPTPILDVLKNAVECGVTSAAILTARSPEAEDDIKEFLSKMGIDLQIVDAVDSSLPSAKSEKFRGYARQYSPSIMHFYEDADVNRKAIEDMVKSSKEFDGIDVYLHNVKKGIKQNDGNSHATYEVPIEPENPMVAEAREKTAKLIVESLSDADVRRIEAIARREMREFLKQNLENKVKKFIEKELKGKENEKIIKDITSKMILDLYKAFWVKRSFWESELK